jgi:FkbH-like protein
MIDTIWADRGRWSQEPDAASVAPPQPAWDLPVARLALTHWEEHCHECAVPHCYSECSVYRARADRRCRRFDYGCMPDYRYRGVYRYGIDVRFGRWAKLETQFNQFSVSPWLARAVDRVSRQASRISKWLSPLVFWAAPIRRVTWITEHARNRFLRFLSSLLPQPADEFVAEVYNLQPLAVPLVVQCAAPSRGVFHRRSIILNPGLNRIRIPINELGLIDVERATVCVYPGDELNARLIFTWLDFVEMRPLHGELNCSRPLDNSAPAENVKCVAWDLDNTVWDGVLIEDGSQGLRLRAAVVDVIRQLDQRGIIHTVVSKNTHEDAWQVLQALGIHEYFIFPAINWGNKSDNLVQVAKRINIGLDAFAFIDDSVFERELVRTTLPMVRVYADQEASTLPQLKPFLGSATEMGRDRRLAYLAEMKREEFRTHAAGDDVDFLRSCEIRASFFRPRTADEIERCLELVQRSNQLNLCARRYSAEQFEQLLQSDALESFGMRCADRFGSYGIVGFITIRPGDEPAIEDLVLSCRVAKRRVEHALVKWLGERYEKQGKAAMTATLVHSPRNHVLAAVFDDLPFSVVSTNAERTTYRVLLERLREIPWVVSVGDP